MWACRGAKWVKIHSTGNSINRLKIFDRALDTFLRCIHREVLHFASILSKYCAEVKPWALEQFCELIWGRPPPTPLPSRSYACKRKDQWRLLGLLMLLWSAVESNRGALVSKGQRWKRKVKGESGDARDTQLEVLSSVAFHNFFHPLIFPAFPLPNDHIYSLTEYLWRSI